MFALRKTLIISLLYASFCWTAVDLIIFSKDRPLQLQALLESTALHIKGLKQIAVLYATSAPSFTTGYRHLAQKFPHVRWIMQDAAKQRSDFAALLRTIFNHMNSPYTMFAVDDIIVIDAIDLEACAKTMEKTGAYGCYFRLGKDINFCYVYNCPMRIPELTHVENIFYEWPLRTGDKCWGYPNTVDMTMYARSTVDEALQHCGYHSPNVFESIWAGRNVPPSAKGICYETSRIINIPLNLVQHDYIHNRCSHRYKTEDLLDLFMQGWRIDIEALIKFPHHAPHVDINVPLTKNVITR